MRLISLLLVAALGATDPLCNDADTKIESIRRLRTKGELQAARELAEKLVDCAAFAAADRIALRLELAEVLEHQGLHHESLPVPEALRHIEAAAALDDDPAPATAAAIELARAGYHYRAEARTRLFPKAILHVQQAISRFQEAGDRHGEADALHLLGVLRFQRGEYDEARELFDRSLAVDDEAGSRPFFRGEHDRYAGFLLLTRGDREAALAAFESSLAAYQQAGAVGESLFAAITYASTLVAADRARDAQEPLLYALMIAEKLDSPSGKSRAALVLGQLYEKLGDPAGAAHAYELTAAIARAIGSDAVERQASASLQRLVTAR
jgi:tetratricopeptide (TPR) repeat protein